MLKSPDTKLIFKKEKKNVEGNGNPLQYSCLENPMGRGAWWATVHRVAKSDMTEATYACMHTFITAFPAGVNDTSNS